MNTYRFEERNTEAPIFVDIKTSSLDVALVIFENMGYDFNNFYVNRI